MDRKVYIWGPHGIVETRFEYFNGMLSAEDVRDMELLRVLEGNCAIIVKGDTYHIFYEVTLQDNPVNTNGTHTAIISYTDHDIVTDIPEFSHEYRESCYEA